MRNIRIFLVTIVAILMLLYGMSGCNQSAAPPPLTVTFRPSLVGKGQVAVIQNNSSHHLYNVKAVGRDLKKLQSASVKVSDHLAPGAVKELGWMEFERWVPRPDETLEFYADDYLVPKIVIIPAIQP